jgi:digeranylgeranylglycerophospholipid reductase
MEKVNVLVIGAGPAGSMAAKAAAEAGATVLMVERRPTIGLPVQCAEYVPARIRDHAPLPGRCIAQRISTMETHLPDGEVVSTPSRGFVIERALFDRLLAAGAARAGARIWTSCRALERTERGTLVQRGHERIEVQAQLVIGADGPRSTVAGWMGQRNTKWIDAAQVEVVLRKPSDRTQVYFHPAYRGGYGWCFPKGETANVGVGVGHKAGVDPREALEHLLGRIGNSIGDVVGRTAGPVPTGGLLPTVQSEYSLLAGDAAGLTHPITGAGILAAVVSGEMAGRHAALAVHAGDVKQLTDYQDELRDHFGGSLRHARSKRIELDAAWSKDAGTLSERVRETWIAFRAYGRRRRGNQDGG